MAIKKSDTPAGAIVSATAPPAGTPEVAPAVAAAGDVPELGEPVNVDPRDTMIAELQRENAELRSRMAVAAAGAAAALARPARPRFLMSEGVRAELQQFGRATDPATGHLLRLDPGTGVVTRTNPATGEASTL